MVEFLLVATTCPSIFNRILFVAKHDTGIQDLIIETLLTNNIITEYLFKRENI